MDFALTEEQQLFSDALRKMLEAEYSQSQRQAALDSETGYSETAWSQMAEMGLMALPFPEAAGGLGGSASDTLIAAIEFGRALSVEPFVASVVLGGGAVRLAGSAEQQDALLPGVISGERKLAAAFLEPQSRHDLSDVECTAEASGDGYQLSGRKAVVLGGDCADTFIVSAKTDKGISLFAVDAGADGVDVRGYKLVDGRGAAEVEFDGVPVAADALIGEEGGALPVIEHVADLGAAALCGEAIGAIEMINEMTLEYLKTRQQFGRPIGSFQALQHRAVDLFLEYEHAKSLVFVAAMSADDANADTRGQAISAAKSYIGTRGREIAKEAVQLHGGIGVTGEYQLGDFVKRVLTADMLFGDADHHLERFGRLSAASPAGASVWAQ